MVQVLNTKPGIGELFGTGLGSGLANSLSYLTQNKLKQYAANQQRQQVQQGLSSLFSPEQAQSLSGLPNELLAPIIKQQLRGPSDAAFLQGLQSLTGAPQEQGTGSPVGESAQGPASGTLQIPAGINSEQAVKLADLSFKKKKQEAAEAAAERGASKDVRDFSAPYREKAEASANNIRDYDTLISLAKQGKLRAGNTQQILDKIGLGGLNRNFDTQLADKLIARLAQNSRTAFGTGSRITNYLEGVFQKSLPSLWNTPEGIIAISEINKRADQVNVLKDNIRKDLLKKWNGKIPGNGDDLVDELAKPEQERLEKEALDIATRAVQSTSKVFDELPSASQFSGKRIRDKDTGKILISNGTDWVEEK
jgi:hypothetical protein